MPENNVRTISAEDLYRLRVVTDCDLSPDGLHVVYSIQRVDRKKEKKATNLWVSPFSGSRPRQFTHGDHADTKPTWSPDGTQIAFLSNRDDENQAQIYLNPFEGGEARRLTDLKGEFRTLEWSPDGSQILCQFRKKDREVIEREKDEQKKELGIVARRVQRVFYKLDGEGFLPRERWHIWVIDAMTGEGTQLTDSAIYDELHPRWSADGSEIVFCSNHAEDPDLDPDAVDIFVIPAEGGDARKLATPVGEKSRPTFSPDGAWVAYVGQQGRGDWWKNGSLWVVPADGGGEAMDLTGHLDIHVGNATINDLPGQLPPSPPTWSEDGERIYVEVSQHGSTILASVPFQEAEPAHVERLSTVLGGSGTVGAFHLDEENARLAYLRADMMEPAEVWAHQISEGLSRRLSNANRALLDGLILGSVEEAWIEGPAGSDIQGWILTPPGFDPANVYPAILEIHGGPRLQYGHFFMHEFFYLAAHGYVVGFCNPRGSRGYGEAHAKAIWNRWGTADYEDLMAWTNHLARQPYIDADRMGVVGGSYGGFMTNWIIGHTDRFRAAVTMRSVSNQISMYGSSDFNWVFQQELGNQPPWEAFDTYWEQSPISHIGGAKTPTMVIHSENDHRCPIEQGEQVFVALKRLGVDTEMIRFPEEPHGLSRGGRTDRRIERLEHVLRWFNKYLRESET